MSVENLSNKPNRYSKYVEISSLVADFNYYNSS